MLGSGIAMWQICCTTSCRIVVSSSVGDGVVQYVRSRCPCSGVWHLIPYSVFGIVNLVKCPDYASSASFCVHYNIPTYLLTYLSRPVKCYTNVDKLNKILACQVHFRLVDGAEGHCQSFVHGHRVSRRSKQMYIGSFRRHHRNAHQRAPWNLYITTDEYACREAGPIVGAYSRAGIQAGYYGVAVTKPRLVI